MSYQAKKTIVSISTGVLILAAYAAYALDRFHAGRIASDDLRTWATAILIFIGIGIVASIVIQIVFHILLSIATAVREQAEKGTCDDKEVEKKIESEMVEDEMDKLIALKSSRVGFAAAGIGFIASLAAMFLIDSPVLMVNILFASFSIGSILEGVAQLHYYKAGIRYGKVV